MENPQTTDHPSPDHGAEVYSVTMAYLGSVTGIEFEVHKGNDKATLGHLIVSDARLSWRALPASISGRRIGKRLKIGSSINNH